MEVRPLSEALGAEIRIDLSRPVDAEARRAIRRAFLDHQVILFRGQDLSEAGQESFCRLFGELELVKASKSKNDAQPHHRYCAG